MHFLPLPSDTLLVAVAVGLLLLICLAMSVQRRRHGQTILPGPAGRIGGGFVRPMAPSINYNNGVYGAGPYRQSQGAGYGQQGAGNDQEYPAPPRRGTPPPPPPYTGKEDSAPQAGGFAPPPGPPPEANMDNSSVRFPHELRGLVSEGLSPMHRPKKTVLPNQADSPHRRDLLLKRISTMGYVIF